jgi:hypothetical protein
MVEGLGPGRLNLTGLWGEESRAKQQPLRLGDGGHTTITPNLLPLVRQSAWEGG